ncbi:MAG: MMPL family transporter [Rhodobacter sp.]|nr:MMPL family transporter [Rhodobacter sp.]
MSTSHRIAGLILRHNRALAVALAVVMAVLIAGIPMLRFSADNRAFFGKDNAEFQDLQALDATYSGASGLLVMVIPPEGAAFAPDTLTALRAMTEEAWLIPNVLRVDSAVNHSHTRASADEIIVEPLLPEDGAITQTDAARFREQAMASDALRDRLVAGDGRAFGIGVQVVLPGERDAGRNETTDALTGLVARWRSEYPGFEFRYTGGILGGLALVEAAKADLTTLVPLAFVAVVAMLSVMLRSVAGVLGSMLVVVSGTLATLGIAGWSGVILTAGTAISPLSVMVLVAASCIHMMLSWMRAHQAGAADAVETALADNLGAITVTTLTTAVGFLCLNFAQSPPLREMGNIIAFGLMFGLAAIFVILPLALARAGRGAGRVLISDGAMRVLAGFVQRHHRLWLWMFPLAILLAISGVLRIGFDDNLVRYFDDRFEFRRNADAIDARLTGLDDLSYSFTAPGGSVFAPAFLRDIDRFQNWLGAQPGVVSVTSITDALKGLNRAMNGDAPGEYRIADSAEANAQLMMFYELSLPQGMDLNRMISVNRDQTRVNAILRTSHSREIRDLADASEAWLAANAPQIATRAAGVSVGFARIAQRNNRQMLVGLAVVLVLVSATMMVALRSVTMGAISLAPNLVPAALAFGLWGYTFGDVNLGSTVVTTMTFGIVVDDTVHFLMHYLRRRRAGMAAETAMQDTFSVVGAAIIITTLALIVGFAIMALSGFVINQHIGALTVFVVGFAVLADLLFLPALLLAFKGAK